MKRFVPVVSFLCLESHTQLYGFEKLLIFFHVVLEYESTCRLVVLIMEFVFDLEAYICRHLFLKGL